MHNLKRLGYHISFENLEISELSGFFAHHEREVPTGYQQMAK